jgi:uncharacterized protein YbjT (DUF2867 family)
MSTKKILVTGATGKTGEPVVKMLTEQGWDVRAMVHQEDERSNRLADFGAEVVIADFLDLASMRIAVKNVDRVYFCYPPFDGLLKATSNLAVAAQDEGVEAVVNMSQISAREGARSLLSNDHWLSENILNWANIGTSHVRPTFFAEDLYLFTAGSVGRDGNMYLPFGNNKHAPVAAEDIARVVVGILIDPEPHIGKYYALTGPRNMNLNEIAASVASGLDHAVQYVNIPVESWHDALVNQAGFPKYLADHLAAVAIDHQDGIFSAETDVVETIGGQKPLSVENFARQNREQFGLAPTLSHV